VPFSPADRPFARGISREAERFATLFRAVPIVKEWPDHPAVRPMLRAFRNINKALSSRDRRGYVSSAQQRRMGREFARIGAALQGRAAARRKTTRKRTTRRGAAKR